MISGFLPMQVILTKLYRDLGINSELNESDVVEWIAEALNTIGAYGQYNEISECLTVTNGKAKLPCGFYKLVDVRYKHKPVYWSSNTNKTNYQCHNCRIPDCNDGRCEHTFYINDSYIITNINDKDDETANLCIVYLGIPVDDVDGYPMVPDDVYYIKALTAYVTFRLDYIEWRKGKLPDKIKADSETDWLFYVNSARGAANMPNTAQLEALKNVLQRLMPLTRQYKRGFKDITKPENLNI